MTLHKSRKFIFLLCLIFSLLYAGDVHAATLYFKPSQGQVSVGNIISVQVLVDTAGKAINNAESIIQFPRDLLEIVSVDKTSIFSLWVQEPSFSNITGQLTFNGGVPNPGYQGNAGKIATITFRTKSAGTASVLFLDSAVRENDGLGTNILTAKSGAEITIVEAPGVIPPPVGTTGSFSIGLTSPTHPNQNNWYSEDNVEMTWRLPGGATAVRTLVGSYPDSVPTVYYATPITKKSVNDLGDGVWYFHVSYYADGAWSSPAHYRLKIDTTDPTDLSVSPEKDESGQTVLGLKAYDALSGIDYFKVIPDTEDPITVKADQNGGARAEIPFSTAGEHSVTVIAYDGAGNSVETSVFVISSIISQLSIDSYPAKIRVNEQIEASGSAPYPYAQIRISLRDSDGVIATYKVKSDSYSQFNFISQPITTEGDYTLWAEIVNDAGEVKYISDKLTVLVEEPLLLRIGSYTIGLMKVLIPALALLILFLLLLLYGWLKFWALYRRVRKESAEAEKIVEKSFDLLRKDLRQHIMRLKRTQSKRSLTQEESDFLEKFEEELSEAEEVIDKEIKDISKS